MYTYVLADNKFIGSFFLLEKYDCLCGCTESDLQFYEKKQFVGIFLSHNQ